MFVSFCNQILGLGMSEKMWDVTIKHAKTCNMGNKLYVYRGPDFNIYLNAICQLIRADINGQVFTGRELSIMNRVPFYSKSPLFLSFNFWILLDVDFDLIL